MISYFIEKLFDMFGMDIEEVMFHILLDAFLVIVLCALATLIGMVGSVLH